MSKELIKEKLNKFGSEKEPFLFVLSYDLSKFYIEKLSKLPNSIKFQLNQKEDFNKVFTKSKLEKFPISFEEYKKKFDRLQEEIKAGNTYLSNLTVKTKIKTSLSLDEIYENTKGKYKIRFQNQEDNFTCFSPETFIKIKDNKIFTYPMKGTIDADISNAKEQILANKKEMAEHTMVVDLLRNDLGIIASNVRVEDFRYIDTINAGDKRLLQVSSKISANLQENWIKNIGDIITSILPAGSITGTPKKKTVEILKEIENYDRDFYTGIFGVFDGKELDSCVMIRFIQEDINGNKYYKSGGGITCDSDVLNEYQELIDKIYLPF
ncbi:aminodeoxychorismate synthase, component I [Arcobacter venerupis]|uniref:Aminodeoxychorismate synthase, component I n=1 Tax=Arcobacter venerupis TaxID=1054033 RepID=A0AAE7B618_9BACT|nr:aminodeoxychorismate synthase component I [Arcobacter venerupis]QKF65973.1 aminodeoxychorismate synthase, component I [Arcobacter venerupis]RWS49332.1 aminodeoxychorismate synthase component I [Arcobacter venerupis]